MNAQPRIKEESRGIQHAGELEMGVKRKNRWEPAEEPERTHRQNISYMSNGLPTSGKKNERK
jgi:hypothetical protein